MNDKGKTLILLRILDQIQQDNEDATNGIEKSIATICKEEVLFWIGILYVGFWSYHFQFLE